MRRNQGESPQSFAARYAAALSWNLARETLKGSWKLLVWFYVSTKVENGEPPRRNHYDKHKW